MIKPASRVFAIGWGAFLVTLVTWPFFLPGEYLWRDMAIVNHMGFIPANFGAGDLAARNSPQDGLLALFSFIAPAPWLVKTMMVSAACAAAWAGYALGGSSWWLGMGIAVFNPFVIERLVQGQWSLVIAAWLLPVIFAAQDRLALSWAAMFGASLTPTGAIFGLIVALVSSRHHRVVTAIFGLFLTLPWLIPGLLSSAAPTDAHAGVAAFSPRAEPYVGTLGSLLTLGGIWNAEALPEGRQLGSAVFGLFLVVLVCSRIHRIQRGAAMLAAVGIGGAFLLWLSQDAFALALSQFPALGLFRDSHKLVALAIPAYVMALGNLHVSAKFRAGALVALFMQMPAAPADLAVLQPHAVNVDDRLIAQLDGRSTLFVDRSPLIEVPGGVAVDPYSKVAATVESGELIVDSVVVDSPSPRWLAAMEAWHAKDLDALERLGVGAVVEGSTIVAQTQAPAPKVPWLLTGLWCLSPVAVAWAARRRST